MRRWVNGSGIAGYFLAAMVAIGCAGSGAQEEDGASGTSSLAAGSAGFSGGMAGSGTSGIGNLPNGMAGTGLVNEAGTGADVAGDMPCDVSTIVANGCHLCHGATPRGGAPMPLVTLADWQKDYVVNTTASLKGQMMKVYQIAKIRVNAEMGTTRMPQGTPLSAEDLGTLNAWLTAGAQSGTECAPPTAGTGIVQAGAGGAGGAAGTGSVRDYGDQCDGGRESGVYDPLVAQDGETCHDFRTHGRSGTDDTSKFTIPLNETYNQFYFSVPWAAGSVATRFGTDFDNEPVLHHWLMFSSHEAQLPGAVVPEVLGTTLFTDSELIAGWAIGGCTTTYPENVGVALPEPNDGIIMVQWHHYNSTGSPQQDGSAAQICTVPAGTRPNVAGLTFLGTENMTVPAGQMATAGGVCVNDSGAPITIIGFTPHMHRIGINMKSVVDRAAGGPQETVFDEVFQPEYQTNYIVDPPVVLQPNDVITSTCTYMNNTSRSITFGQSTDAEMCYQFALAYPYGALNNGVVSLIGATNTCW